MILGFYYHIPVHNSNEGIKIPAYLGVFLDSLAHEVNKLYLFMHEARDFEIQQCDYMLKSDKIDFISLGLKTPAWKRFLFPRRTLNKIRDDICKCDVILVRAPSPLAPAFFFRFNNRVKVVFLIVGDYLDGIKYLHFSFIRKTAIYILTRLNNRRLKKAISNTLTLVNSNDLYEKYKNISANIKVVRTTTISEKDLYYRSDTCNNDIVNLLYTGRIDLAKGLRELVQAVSYLSGEGFNVILHLAGWEEDKEKPVEKLLLQMANNFKIEKKVIFHGRKTMGEDLNSVYQMADIFIIPSYHEGFPRVIWEAMANGLPVIATKVGSIPSFVEDSVLLIDPHNSLIIEDAIKKIINDPSLRRNLIELGYKKAKENTLEIRVKEITDILKSF